LKDVREIVAKNIKKYRERAGLAQKDLAEKLNINVSAISNYETGISSPSIDKLAIICDVLNVRPTVMMGLVDEYADRQTEADALLTRYNQAPEHVRLTIDSLLKRQE
jgi:transcriptional regulator with XRE-family HTH domain